ncbi:MAG: hypothetical protein H0T82_03305, partial [Sphingomonas sp.]|nr:hypothetical protein [Sphingomonas sp.]
MAGGRSRGLVFHVEVVPGPAARQRSWRTLVFLLDAIVERAADVLEEVALQTDTLKSNIFRRDTGPDRKRITNEVLEELMLEIGRAERALSKVRESLSSLTRLISYLLFALPTYDPAEVS